MFIERIRWIVLVGFAALLPVWPVPAVGTAEATPIDLVANVGAWQNDGHWHVERTADGVRFWKDELPAHKPHKTATANARSPRVAPESRAIMSATSVSLL